MTPKRLTFAIPLIFALPACLPAQVTVLTSGGFSAAHQEFLLQFENTTGITVAIALIKKKNLFPSDASKLTFNVRSIT